MPVQREGKRSTLSLLAFLGTLCLVFCLSDKSYYWQSLDTALDAQCVGREKDLSIIATALEFDERHLVNFIDLVSRFGWNNLGGVRVEVVIYFAESNVTKSEDRKVSEFLSSFKARSSSRAQSQKHHSEGSYWHDISVEIRFTQALPLNASVQPSRATRAEMELSLLKTTCGSFVAICDIAFLPSASLLRFMAQKALEDQEINYQHGDGDDWRSLWLVESAEMPPTNSSWPFENVVFSAGEGLQYQPLVYRESESCGTSGTFEDSEDSHNTNLGKFVFSSRSAAIALYAVLDDSGAWNLDDFVQCNLRHFFAITNLILLDSPCTALRQHNPSGPRANTRTLSRAPACDSDDAALQSRPNTMHIATPHFEETLLLSTGRVLQSYKPSAKPTSQGSLPPAPLAADLEDPYQAKGYRRPGDYAGPSPDSDDEPREDLHSAAAAGTIIHLPIWALDRALMRRLNSRARREGSAAALLPAHMLSQSAEDEYAYKHFFPGCRGGSFLEIGALDGLTASNTYALEKDLGWRGVLVEGDPNTFRLLAENRPGQVLVNAAVCDRWQTVHYIHSGEYPGVRGIREFMEPGFRNYWHLGQPTMYYEVTAVCVPLGDVLGAAGFRHINFFSLDVEGGELAVLATLDFGRFSFDVIAAERGGEDASKDRAVEALLTRAGYRLHSNDGRNDWYARDGFESLC